MNLHELFIEAGGLVLVVLSAPMVAFWSIFGYAIARTTSPVVGAVLGAIEGVLICLALACGMISLKAGIWVGTIAFIYAVFMIRWLDQRRIF